MGWGEVPALCSGDRDGELQLAMAAESGCGGEESEMDGGALVVTGKCRKVNSHRTQYTAGKELK